MDEQQTPPNQPPVDPMAVHAKKILLVEDDDALASVYQTRLQAEGFDLRRVPNGEEALSAALEYRPDLVLLDVMMPKVSGFDVLDILRNTPETLNVKVIMLTALSQDSDKERAESLGVDDYLVKSQVVIADVVDRIKQHLGIQHIIWYSLSDMYKEGKFRPDIGEATWIVVLTGVSVVDTMCRIIANTRRSYETGSWTPLEEFDPSHQLSVGNSTQGAPNTTQTNAT